MLEKRRCRHMKGRSCCNRGTRRGCPSLSVVDPKKGGEYSVEDTRLLCGVVLMELEERMRIVRRM